MTSSVVSDSFVQYRHSKTRRLNSNHWNKPLIQNNLKLSVSSDTPLTLAKQKSYEKLKGEAD